MGGERAEEIRRQRVEEGSVQFSSRWYLCARKSPYVLHPVSKRFPQRHLWNGFNVRLIEDGPLSSFQGRLSSASSFHTSWCDALGFVPACSVSSSSTLQLFQEASHLWGLLCPPVCLLGYFSSLRHVQGSAPTGVEEGEGGETETEETTKEARGGRTWGVGGGVGGQGKRWGEGGEKGRWKASGQQWWHLPIRNPTFSIWTLNHIYIYIYLYI